MDNKALNPRDPALEESASTEFFFIHDQCFSLKPSQFLSNRSENSGKVNFPSAFVSKTWAGKGPRRYLQAVLGKKLHPFT